MKDLIPLQNAHVNQSTTEKDGKSDWIVLENITEEFLYTLPKHWDEITVFEALDFARKYELKALNVGINFGVTKMVEKFNIEREALRKHINDLTLANEKLAEKLEKYIGE